MRPDRPAARREPGAPATDLPGGNPWLLVWTIVAAKAATILAILAFSRSMETGGIVLVTQWHWVLLLGALLAAPVAYAIRLRRVRARRDALRRAEWFVADDHAVMPPPVDTARFRS